MIHSLEHLSDLFINLRLSRRDCLRLFLSGCGFYIGWPNSIAKAKNQPSRGTIIDQFLEEELIYQIGFWLFHRCGEARTSFLETSHTRLYRASLEGRTVGIVDALLGKYRYSYVSYLEFSSKSNRLRPICFHLQKNRAGTETRKSVTFNYARKEIVFSQILKSGRRQKERVSMQNGIVYEDYMTLFYNFRYGCYGPLERGRIYQLPLQIHKGTESIELSIAPREEEERHRKKEANKTGKDFFLRFRVHGEDVSSTSGEIEGWLSSDAVPVKGTIRDVVLFGDLWGELVGRQMRGSPHQARSHVAVPEQKFFLDA